MTERYPGWVDGMDAQDARLATGTLAFPATEQGVGQVQARSGLRPGPGEPGRVVVTTTGVLEVLPFQGVIQDAEGSASGAYLVTLDMPKTIDLLGQRPADQEHPRIDLVVAERVEPAADAPTGFLVHAIHGEPGPNPQPPAVGDAAIKLAQVMVAPQATQLGSDNVIDLRAYTCAVGGVLPITDTDALPTNAYAGLYVHNIADRTLETFDGTAWHRFPRIASGTSDKWQPYGSNTGIFVEVDTSAARFSNVPVYITSLLGNNEHWGTTGGSSVYSPTARSFRVYVRWFDGHALTPKIAKDRGWRIGWIGIET